MYFLVTVLLLCVILFLSLEYKRSWNSDFDDARKRAEKIAKEDLEERKNWKPRRDKVFFCNLNNEEIKDK